jgi:hypothetical protein
MAIKIFYDLLMLGAPPKNLVPPDPADDPRVSWALLNVRLLKYLCHILNYLIDLESFIILKIGSAKTERGILHPVRNVGRHPLWTLAGKSRWSNRRAEKSTDRLRNAGDRFVRVIGEKNFQEIFEIKMLEGTHGLVGIINKHDVGIGIPQTTKKLHQQKQSL